MKILLATDGSVHSNAAVVEIAGRPFPYNTELRIISAFRSNSFIVSEPAPMGGLAGNYKEAGDIAKKHAEGAVKIAVQIINEKNPALSISTKVINEYPKQGILNEADLFGADLIVVGSHGQGALTRFLIGSVSHSVALHASCSVLIVRIPVGVRDENNKKVFE